MIKKYQLEVTPDQFDVISRAVDNYHTFLHDAKRYKHDIRLPKKIINRSIVVCHGMLATFEQEIAYIKQGKNE